MKGCGIDVSKDTLDVVIRHAGKSLKVVTYDNTPAGHATLVKQLLKSRVTHVCLEATGNYHLDLAVALDAAKGIAVMVINPRAARHFAKAMMQQNKTDAIDAELLAQFVERMEFVAWQAPDAERLALRTCSRWMVSQTKALTKLKNQLHAFESTQQTPDFIIEDVKQSINHLQVQIDKMVKQAVALIKQHEALAAGYHLLVSIKGVAAKSAVKLLGELCILPADMTAKQWVAHAALFPRIIESGKSVSKKPRIGLAGNRYVREALYMPALNAAHRDPNVSAFYQHLVNDNGLTKLQALCAVMRKLLVAIHAMLRTGKPFQSAWFYAVA